MVQMRGPDALNLQFVGWIREPDIFFNFTSSLGLAFWAIKNERFVGNDFFNNKKYFARY